MLRTQKEIEELGKNIMNMVVADILFECRTVARAINKVDKAKWQGLLDDLEKQVSEIILSKFGSSG